MKVQTEKNSWKYRRRIIHLTLIFCSIMVAYLVFFAPSDSLRENLAIALTGLAATVITGYVFGAVLDDRYSNARHTRKDEDHEDHL